MEIIGPDEVDYGTAHRRVSDIGLYSLKRVEHRSAALVDMSVAFGYIVDLLFGESVFAHDPCVDAVVAGRIVGYDDVWRNVAAYAASAFDQNPLGYFASFVKHRT